MTKEKQLIEVMGIDVRLEQVTILGYTLNYVTAGKGPVALFLHGANIGWGQWYKTLVACAPFFTVIAVDLPGTGGSTKINYHETDIVSQSVPVVEEFIRYIQRQYSVDDVALVGHSFGGWVALKIASEQPDLVRCCALSSPVGFSSDMPLHQRMLGVYPVAWLLSRTVLKPHVENIHKFLLDACYRKEACDRVFSEYVHESMHRGTLSHPFLFIHSLLSGLKMRKELVFQSDITDTQIPTCIVFGVFDPVVSYLAHEPRCRTLLPKASIIAYNTGHVPMLEQPDQFNKDLISFLHKHSPACQYGVSY